MKHAAGFACLFFILSGCNFFKKSPDKNQQVIARVYDKYLYQSDLKGVGGGAASRDDSIQAVRNYVDSWIRHNLLLRYAQDNLPDEEQRLNDRLRDYKESLLIYQYENDLVNQKLDTTVSDTDIQKYYNENSDAFTLKNDIVKFKYVMLPATTIVRLDSVRAWLRNMNDYNKPKLLGFCKQYATRFSINDSTWNNKDDLASFLPVNKINITSALISKNYLEASDSGFAYLIKFDDYRVKGSNAPVDFVQNEIISILLNQRKIDFISRIHKSIYDDALKDGDFEIYMDEGIKTKK